MKKQVFLILTIMLIAGKLYSQSLYNGVGHVPSTSQVEWTNAGFYSIPDAQLKYVWDVNDFGADDTGATSSYFAVMEAIDSARAHSSEGYSAIYFPEGDYAIGSTIEFDYGDSNMVVLGDGSNKTTITYNGWDNLPTFDISGYQGDLYEIENDISKDDSTLKIDDLDTYFDPGDWIHYFEDSYPGISPTFNEVVGQVTRISSINSATDIATLKDKASKDYVTNYDLVARKMYVVKNIGFEKFKVIRSTTSHYDGASTFGFGVAVNCWITGVESYKTAEVQVGLAVSSHIVIRGNYFHEANNYGGDGRAYGVVMNVSTTNSLVENNIFRKLRHSMLVQGGANTNVYAYNYSREPHWMPEGIIVPSADLVLHGNWNFANLFEHNYVEWIRADATHPDHGPYTVFLRNHSESAISLSKVDGTSIIGNDVIYHSTLNRLHGNDYQNEVEFYAKALVLTDPLVDTYDEAPFIQHNYQALIESQIQGLTWQLQDNSYYYSSRPSFVNASYGFPSIGPGTSNNIPAKDRWNNTVKTYDVGTYSTAIPSSVTLTITNSTAGQSPSFGWTTSTHANYYDIYKRNLSISTNWSLRTSVTGTSWTDAQEIIDYDRDADELEYYVVARNLFGESSASNTVEISVESEMKLGNSALPKDFALMQNYPNPFNPVTSIRYELPKNEHVTLRVFSITGQLVAELVNESRSAGYHNVQWDASSVASGVYIYKVTAGGFSETKKMVVMK